MDTHVVGPADGLHLEVLELGAAVHRLWVPTATGPRNVVLGHRTLEEYAAGSAYHGATIGRVANRLAGGCIDVDGTTYTLDVNDGDHTLHGGSGGFHARTWTVGSATRDELVLSLESPSGDQGFPGNVRATATYTVVGDEVRIDLTAVTDAPTPVSLTNHSYLNLDGEGAGPVDDHRLSVRASRITESTPELVPTGAFLDVDGTPFDLRRPVRVGDVVRADHPQVLAARGLDHNFVLDGEGLRDIATVETSDLAMTLTSDAPGLQVYSGNFLDGSDVGTGGRVYRQGDGLALEPQDFPDTPHHPAFGSVLLAPGDTFRRTIVWRFTPRLTP
ncbi:MAG: galactose mutarotase [Nocardioidaceae bacterium]|nr:galactose mutarotase [Nocardioidaceae bacterium]NUS50465.1 galactose mutarotase [Nocardioidaceae bacterium]